MLPCSMRHMVSLLCLMSVTSIDMLLSHAGSKAVLPLLTAWLCSMSCLT